MGKTWPSILTHEKTGIESTHAFALSLVCPVLLVFCEALALSQQPQTTAEMSQHDAPVTFSTAVNLVLVPVVVRDAKGNAVGTLTKDDFQLFDKGKPQTIDSLFHR